MRYAYRLTNSCAHGYLMLIWPTLSSFFSGKTRRVLLRRSIVVDKWPKFRTKERDRYVFDRPNRDRSFPRKGIIRSFPFLSINEADSKSDSSRILARLWELPNFQETRIF